ncbi:MAG: protein kinase, partial [Nannocystis sp.]|nr:protein kinase [Nannocystis sp.]
MFGLPRQPVTIDRYEIVKLLGSGAMGLVYEVFDPIRGEQVALKTLRGHSPRALALFKREFRALSRITHPNLVGLYELGRDQQQFFFTMELVRGMPLLRYLWGAEPDLAGAGELPLSPVADFARLRGVFSQLAEGVHALHHARKLHRDIKPSNVMVTHQGRVVLMDFGFVGEDSIGTLESTAGSIIVGTPAYMAPEQAAGGPRTGASDWYSVGATLYMALTGQVPFHGETLGRMMERKRSEVPPPPRSLAAGIPEDLDQLCLRLLQPEPAARISSTQLLAALHQQPHGAEHSLTRGVPYLSPAATHIGARRFIGRAADVGAMRRAHASVCASNRPAVMLVRGRAGLGKSALVRHITDELRANSTVVLRARCYERDGVPLKALDSLIDALARHLRQQPRPGLGDVIAALSPLFPVLQAGEGSAQALGEQRPDELDEAAFVALGQLLARLAEPRPLVLWLDDLQWGDPGSMRALQRVLAPGPDTGPAPAILLIASYRSEDSATSPALHVIQDMSLAPGLPVHVLELGPLAPDETLALAEAVLGADTARARLDGLAAEAQGSPQFLHDLARFVAHGPDAAPEVTLDELLEIRIARLTEPQRRLLDA